MKRALVAVAFIAVVAGGCGDNGNPTTGTSSGGTTSASSSGTGGGGGTGTGSGGGATGTGTAAGTSTGAGGAPPCTPKFQIKGSVDTTAIDRTFCHGVGENAKGPGWVSDGLYFDDSSAPALSAASVLWGDEAYSPGADATGGILELPADGPIPAIRVCLGAITHAGATFSSTSLSTLGACPGQATSDALTASFAVPGGGKITGNVGGAAVNDVVTGYGCYGPTCSLSLKSGGIVLFQLADDPQPGQSVSVVEAYVRIPANAPAVKLFCGSLQSIFKMPDASSMTLSLKGLTSPGTCPGTPLLGDITVTSLGP